MREKFTFSNSQTLTTLTSVGEISDDIWDLEEDGVVDQQLIGYLNITIIGGTFTSGATEGLIFGFRTDDTDSLDTAQDTAGLGYIDCAMKHVEIVDLMVTGETSWKTGSVYSIPVQLDVAKRYLGAWYKAKNTTLTGNIIIDAHFDLWPRSKRAMQKNPA